MSFIILSALKPSFSGSVPGMWNTGFPTPCLLYTSKKRQVKLYKLFSTENILCQYVKQILDRIFKIKYPNQNKAVHTLFDFFKASKQMSEFTIIKCDYKDYFNSVSSAYVFEKYIKGQMTNRAETELISTFASQTKYSLSLIHI